MKKPDLVRQQFLCDERTLRHERRKAKQFPRQWRRMHGRLTRRMISAPATKNVPLVRTTTLAPRATPVGFFDRLKGRVQKFFVGRRRTSPPANRREV